VIFAASAKQSRTMNKYIAIVLLAIPVLFAFSGDPETDHKNLPAGCFVRKSTPAKGIAPTQSKLVINFRVTDNSIVTDSIRFAYNGKTAVLFPDKNGTASVLVPSGITRFQFLLNTDYFEVYSDTINLKGGNSVDMDVRFEPATYEIIVDKPVIYVYPDVTQSVNIQLNVQGTLGFSYPRYNIPNNSDSAVDGWTFMAHPDGTLDMNGRKYDYLFWDGKIEVTNTFNLKPTGFIVQRDSLVPFFERQLTIMNLSSREQEDFITYWAPRMQKNKASYIRFVFNEGYDQFASIKVFPQPKNIFRVMMVWQDASTMEGIKILPQAIPAAKRDGFSVIEWGGTEVSAQSAAGSTQ
jgi:hypothetical protein